MKKKIAELTTPLPPGSISCPQDSLEPEEPQFPSIPPVVGPEPWYKLDPEDALDPWGEFEEPELPMIPMTIGPASRSGPPAYNPMSVQPPGLDVASLAAQLNWKV